MSDNKVIGTRIKQVREEMGLTQEELGKAIGLNKSTVQRYESAKIEKIKLPVIDAIARRLDVNPDWLSDKTDDRQGYAPGEEMPELKGLGVHALPPVFTCKYYHSVSAGMGAYAEESYGIYSYYFKSRSQAEQCFAVDIKGDSMEPELHEGDIAIVDTQLEPQNNDIVVMYDKSDDLGYIKQYRKTDNCVMFISYNTAYPPMIYQPTDLADRVKIYGKVVAINRKY